MVTTKLLSLALLTPTSATTSRTLADQLGDVANVKSFGALGNGTANDTAAIQAAVDACFGIPGAPHGLTSSTSNKALMFPSGTYKITAPILFPPLVGARIFGGAGNLATRIIQATSGQSVFVTNSFSHSKMEGISLETAGGGSIALDLDWDGNSLANALQSNRFEGMWFSGDIGVRIGNGGVMGSENTFLNCRVSDCATAGYKIVNYNALANVLVGGNISTCAIGVWVLAGQVGVHGTGFQGNTNRDIKVDNSSNASIVVVGARTESKNFIETGGYSGLVVQGCSQHWADDYTGRFVYAGGPAVIEACQSLAGSVAAKGGQRIIVRSSQFGKAEPFALDSSQTSAIFVENSWRDGTFVSWGETGGDQIYILREVNGLGYGSHQMGDVGDVGNVKYLGALGNGSTDDTVAVQAAINAYAGKGLRFPAGTYIVSALTIPSPGITMFGDGGAVIKQKASTASSLFTCSVHGVTVRASGLTFDGNYSAQADDADPSLSYHTFEIRSHGSSASAPANWSFDNCQFINGRYADIYWIKNDVDSLADTGWLSVSNCQFLGGSEGIATTRNNKSIHCIGGINARVENNLFDLQRTPTVVGRSGVVLSRYTTPPSAAGKVSVIGNEFRNMGRCSSDVFGSIDLYSFSAEAIITGNRVMQPYGRGINIKSDQKDCVISGNVVVGLNTTATGTFCDAQIVVNQSVTASTTNGNWAIANNVLRDNPKAVPAMTVCFGPETGTGNATNCVISGNVIENSADDGIYLKDAKGVTVANNRIRAGTTAIYFSEAAGSIVVSGNSLEGPTGAGIFADSSNATLRFLISANQIDTPGTYGIFLTDGLGGTIQGNYIRNPGNFGIVVASMSEMTTVRGNAVKGSSVGYNNGASNVGLWVHNNDFETPIGFTNRTLTLASDATTVWTEAHYVDTEGAAASDNLSTLNGGIDNREVTLSPANGARVVTVKHGTGNIRLAGGTDFVMSGSRYMIRLRHNGTEWREISRSAVA
jgi:parallel beta-helix repeat protein